MSCAVDDLPGYRRRISIEPRDGAVLAMLEDDLHCMAVTLHHADGVVIAVEPVMERVPWTTCSGARDQLIATFTGQPLADVTARRAKRANCTHLHDLASFAAAHAGDGGSTTYDVLISDPRDGVRLLELRRDGESMLRWREYEDRLVEPEGAAGLTLMTLRDWIETLPEADKEPARTLQWAGLVAHGRLMTIAEQQALAPNMPPNCYTFQPERRTIAIRNGPTRDFSDGSSAPLDRLAEKELARLEEKERRRLKSARRTWEKRQ
jgi:hypothetical protein